MGGCGLRNNEVYKPSTARPQNHTRPVFTARMTTQKSFGAGSDFPPLKDGVIRLYSMRFCPYAERSRLVLAHKRIPYETVNVDLKNKPQWFLDKNPLGLVPVLEIGDKIVYESAIVNDYLDDIFHKDRLTPDSPYQRARDKILLERFGKFTTNYYKAVRAKGEDLEALIEYNKAVSLLETELTGRGDFFGGDSVKMIDFNMWPHIYRTDIVDSIVPTSNMGIKAEKYPKLSAWIARMKTVPAVQETLYPLEWQIGFMKGFLENGKPNYDIGLDS